MAFSTTPCCDSFRTRRTSTGSYASGRRTPCFLVGAIRSGTECSRHQHAKIATHVTRTLQHRVMAPLRPLDRSDDGVAWQRHHLFPPTGGNEGGENDVVVVHHRKASSDHRGKRAASAVDRLHA